MNTTVKNMLDADTCDSQRGEVYEKLLEAPLATSAHTVTQYGDAEMVVGTGRATCRDCGERILKGTGAIKICEDFTGNGGWTAQDVSIHMLPCTDRAHKHTPRELEAGKVWGTGVAEHRARMIKIEQDTHTDRALEMMRHLCDANDIGVGLEWKAMKVPYAMGKNGYTDGDFVEGSYAGTQWGRKHDVRVRLERKHRGDWSITVAHGDKMRTLIIDYWQLGSGGNVMTKDYIGVKGSTPEQEAWLAFKVVKRKARRILAIIEAEDMSEKIKKDVMRAYPSKKVYSSDWRHNHEEYVIDSVGCKYRVTIQRVSGPRRTA